MNDEVIVPKPNTIITRLTDRNYDPLKLAVGGFLARYNGSTLKGYRIQLGLFLKWCHGYNLNPLEVHRAHIELYLRQLEMRGLASQTRNTKFGVVYLFYKYALLDKLVKENPCDYVARPKIMPGERKLTWLPVIDSVVLLNHAVNTGPKYHLMVVIMAQMALRVGELCSLDVGSVRDKNGWRTLKFVGKGGDTYERVLPVQVIPDLERHIEGRGLDEPLFVNNRGVRITRASAARVVKNLAREAGIKREITPHGLRRSAATNMLAQGIPLRDVQIQLRHVDPKMTLRYDMGKETIDRSAVLPYASHQYSMINAR